MFLALKDKAVQLSASPVMHGEQAKIEAYPLFDWLRFLLASIVVWHHAGVPLPGPIEGKLAVYVFLALSGWLIGGILLQTGKQELPRFFYNRATRIWVPYFASVAALYGLAAMRYGIDVNWLKYLFYDLTFTHYTWTEFPRALKELPMGGTGNHFWSISVEEQFYLAAPLLIIFVKWGKQIWPWLLISIALLAFQSMFTMIALGVLAAVVHRKLGESGLPAWNSNTLYQVGMALIAAALFAFIWQNENFAAMALFSIAVVLATAIPGKRSKLGLIAGAVSYPLYLNHWLGGYAASAVNKLLLPMNWSTLLFMNYILSVVISLAAWYVIDKQILARRNGWYTPAWGYRLGIAAYALLAIGLAGGLAIKGFGG
jgi:peptidoglycan/LPS O-acetylase OafA/YrhL